MKRYELSNHLGNVLAVITDRRIQACTNENVMFYQAQEVSITDYDPFGMGIEERTWIAINYRFGFNGKEQVNEVSGTGNTIAFEERIFDSRLGRFLSVDPRVKEYAWQSTYCYFKNSPVSTLDLLGGGGPYEEDKSLDADNYGLVDELDNSQENADNGLGSTNIRGGVSKAVIPSTDPSTTGTLPPPLKTFPAYSVLASNYPATQTPEQVYNGVGGKVLQNRNSNPRAFENTCAIRMCVAFNKSGADIEPNSTEKTYPAQAGTGSDSKWYYYRVSSFSNYLNREYGAPDKTFTVSTTMTATDIQASLSGQTGIIQYNVSGWSDASGHFTLYNGSTSLHGDYFDPAHLGGATLISVNFWTIR
jgi:RHS repeat-associated protein